jgi:hypothetical protein
MEHAVLCLLMRMTEWLLLHNDDAAASEESL